MSITDKLEDFYRRSDAIKELRKDLIADLISFDASIDDEEHQDAFDEMIVDIADDHGYSHNIWDRDSEAEELELWISSNC